MKATGIVRRIDELYIITPRAIKPDEYRGFCFFGFSSICTRLNIYIATSR